MGHRALAWGGRAGCFHATKGPWSGALPALHACRPSRNVPAAAAPKEMWLQTGEQACLTTAVEAGHTTMLFTPATRSAADEWRALAAFDTLFLDQDTGTILDVQGTRMGCVVRVGSKEELRAAEATAATASGYVVMDASDWKVIPAENLVATFQAAAGGAKLLGVAATAADARVMLEALELGTAGVLLRTDDPAEVRQLAAYLRERNAQAAPRLVYEGATVTSVAPVGMGDRVCVDLCCMLEPGEGMLVGSFSRALFLVHSECMESAYINSRPFRVNAGAVHAYIQAPGDRTAYLSELSSGSEVLVADAAGSTRTALVGRIKLEARPLMLVEAETADGERVSTLLQNAETVRLVGPAASKAAGAATAAATSGAGQAGAAAASSGGQAAGRPWHAVSVSELRPGDEVYVLRQGGARHTGISIEERITER